MSCFSYLDVPDLLDEVWAQVFLYLPVEDRKSVRLCCRRFYEICNSRQMQKSEELVFCGNFNTSAAILSLCDSARKLWNIKLDHVSLTDLSILPFFVERGEQIRSLAFDSCEQPRRGLIRQIMLCCKRLLEVNVILDSEGDLNSYHPIIDDFVELKSQQFVCNSVTTFVLEIPAGCYWNSYFHLKNNEFSCFFDIFPNIRHLSLTLEVDENFDNSVDVENLKFSCVYNQLMKIRPQLESLKLHFAHQQFFVPFLSIPSWLKIADFANNLKELSLNWVYLWDESIKNPFSNFKHLTHFECVVDKESVPYSTFVTLLLRTAPKLQSLKVLTRSCFRMELECFEALIRSRLTSLSIRLWIDEDEDELSQSVDRTFDQIAVDGSLVNQTLRHLDICTDIHSALALFTIHFKNLENITCPDVESYILSRVFQLPQLRTLVLHNCDEYPLHHCRSVSYSMMKQWAQYSNLRFHRQLNLTHLHVVEEKSLDLCQFLLSEFLFPKLKSLRIDINPHYDPDEEKPKENFNFDFIWLKIRELDKLESLDIRCGIETSSEQWLELFSALPKLHHFIFLTGDCALFSDAQYQYSLQTHPSLRWICIIKPGQEEVEVDHIGYLKDVTTNSVEKRIKTAQVCSDPVNAIF